MRYRLLGPLQVVQGDTPVELGPPKQRAVLAVLLPAQGRVVSVARGIAEPTGGVPTLLRCRLLECALTESRSERGILARSLADDAAAMGMAGVAQAARLA